MNSKSYRSRGGLKDDHVNLVTESLPNYAKIDHFAIDPFLNDS